MYAKVLIFEKKRCLSAGFEPTASWMHVSSSTHWAIWLWFFTECFSNFSTFSSSTSYRMQADHRNTLQWQTWSRRMMGLWCYVNLSSPRRVISMTDRWTDRFSALYIYRLQGCLFLHIDTHLSNPLNYLSWEISIYNIELPCVRIVFQLVFNIWKTDTVNKPYNFSKERLLNHWRSFSDL